VFDLYYEKGGNFIGKREIPPASHQLPILMVFSRILPSSLEFTPGSPWLSLGVFFLILLALFSP